MNNNANNLFEHIKESPYFNERLEDIEKNFINFVMKLDYYL